MNKAKLKTYAPQARKDFIAAVTARAHQLGIADSNGHLDIAPAEKTGDLVLIAGQAWPGKVYPQRERLIQRLQKDGFTHTLDAIAYTWFNRFAALRYMEIHDTLGHGHRVLSSREGGLPEILAQATELVGVLPGLKAQPVADMKLAGNQDGELYRLLLVAQCNALSAAMPFLFERIDDETELLLPENLLRTDSVITQLVAAIPEDDWADIEIIGWLYQFYISEKKDEVIGKVVKSKDIPAATQLFTPNWIVQYLVQNSVGRLWLMANPASGLKSQWPYYIEPAEQTPEVQAQLDALIKTRMDEDGGSLNPETITVLDPACGSGHILVEAYEVLKGIYLERGYQARAVPRLILEKNLYGLDIDDRAAQLASFALLMKARADDRRLLDSPIKLNVLSLQESAGMDLDEFAGHLMPHGINRTVLGSLLDTFTHAKTFGSLIQIPKLLEDGLAGLEDGIAKAIESGDVFAKAAAQDLVPLVRQARILALQFDAVVANPPYMGSKFYDSNLKKFVVENYQAGKADLYGAFALRNIWFAKRFGYVGMITIPNWMFLSSFEEMRSAILCDAPISSLIHNGRGVFGSDFGSCSFVLWRDSPDGLVGSFLRLFDKQGSVSSNEELVRRFHENDRFNTANTKFKKIPGAPIAYNASVTVLDAFAELKSLGSVVTPRLGMRTGNNDRFLRFWHEVDIKKFASNHPDADSAKISGSKWIPYNKGGQFRKWYGNREMVVNWENNGYEIKANTLANYPQLDWNNLGWKISNEEFYFKRSITWADVTAGANSFRDSPVGAIFDGRGSSAFPDTSVHDQILGFLNSNVALHFLGFITSTLVTTLGDLKNLPWINGDSETGKIVRKLVSIAEFDWNAYELSWGFHSFPVLNTTDVSASSLSSSYDDWVTKNLAVIAEMKRLEEDNNRLFIDAYGLSDELTLEVPIEQITLTVNPAYRYSGNLSEEEQWARFRQDTMVELISYAIGCMMGRYSLDEPGLICAHAGNVGFDATRYKTFPADADGIVPVTDELWFEDDAANRIREFILAVWPAPTFEENMAWLAESLGSKGNETPDETIRRYLASSFFKDHLQTYKKRPIYWLFSSGKQGAFQALVYLHRYHEGTLARMRAEYVVPLTGKMQSRIEMLEKDKDAAPSTAARNKLAKQIESLKKKHVELLAYDEKLRHYADRRISLDLDDGVKVNYGKFGDLLDSVKAITGGTEE